MIELSGTIDLTSPIVHALIALGLMMFSIIIAEWKRIALFYILAILSITYFAINMNIVWLYLISASAILIMFARLFKLVKS